MNTSELLAHHNERIQSMLSRPWFFICGMEKSGTTWLQRILDTHPHILTMGEGHFGDTLCRKLAEGITEYNTVLARTAQDVYGGKMDNQPLTQDEFNLLWVIASLMSYKGEIAADVKLIGEKTPSNAYFMEGLSRAFPRVKFLHIIRDGRDVVVSAIRHMQRVTKDEQAWNMTASTERVAEVWVKMTEAARKFGAANPECYHELRYEALLSDFDRTVEGVLQFLGMEHTPEIIAQCREKTDFKTLSGGRDAGKEDRNAFLRKGISGDWRNHFDEATLKVFESKAGKLMDELGYATEDAAA